MIILQRPGSVEQQSALLERDPTELSDELELALRLGQVEIRFQPQFAGDSGHMVGAEALARWKHPRFGEIGARDLFDLAARAGLADDLPGHILSLAVAEARNWPEGFRLSVNVTPKQLLAEGFVARFSGEVASSQLDPKQVTLEITEELLLGDLDLAARQLKQLRDLGFRIALDDFGAGFCNFDYLKRLPLDALKLDRSMVQGIVECERDLAVLRAIVTLARVLGLDVVAEGIETEEQRLAVVAEGCSSWQGFLGSEPLTREDLLQLA